MSFVSRGAWLGRGDFPRGQTTWPSGHETNHAAAYGRVLHWMPIASERIHGYAIVFRSEGVLVG